MVKFRRTSMARKIRNPEKTRSSRTRKAPRAKKKIGRKILAGLVLSCLVFFSVRHSDFLLQKVGIKKPGSPGLELVTGEEASDQKNSGEVKIKDTRDKNSESGEIAEQDTAEIADDSKNIISWLSLKPLLNKVFIVENIKLKGVYSIARDSLSKNLERLIDEPLLDLDLPVLAEQLEKHPRIKEVSLRRQLPKTLVVKVNERREVAQVIVGNKPLGIDRDGVILSKPQPGWPVDVAVITGYKKRFGIGEQISNTPVKDALKWIRAAEKYPLVSRWITELEVQDPGLTWISGADGMLVKPGKHNIEAQVATINAYLVKKQTEKTEPGIIDLTFPGYLILCENREKDENTTATDA